MLTKENRTPCPLFGVQIIGGEGGIRTLGTVARTPVFETGAFDHSATSPYGGYTSTRHYTVSLPLTNSSMLVFRRFLFFFCAWNSVSARMRLYTFSYPVIIFSTLKYSSAR